MASRSPGDVYGELVDRLVLAAGGDARVKALWLEGPAISDLRRPYRRIEIHLACDEPDFAAVLAGLEAHAGGAAGLRKARWSDVPRFARQLEAELEGAPVTLVLEKTSLLAKRPRAAVVSLVDRTGHLTHVMDFARKQP